MKRERLTITLRSDIISKIDKKIDGQIIRNRSHAIENILTEKLKSNILKKAILLGGGEGIEINGEMLSKLLLPIDGKTLVEKNIETLKAYGITDLILSLGKLGDQVREKLNDGSQYGIKIVYFERDRGNADVLRQAKSLLEETFLMMNGDILLDTVDIDDMYQFHKNNTGKATVLVATTDNPSDLGSIRMKGNLITDFEEKPNEETESHLINGGVYLIEPEVSALVNPEIHFLETEIFPQLAAESKLCGYSIGDKWIHLHDRKKYEEYVSKIEI
ncbi:MAG TPA: nucleotidyltransferase family protein [Patescibacteria group bacterium]|nr:nucleotidyltransferase family protein [Patescibacteria group bacterium]